MAEKGLFITFEGCDGSGKTTQAQLLAERLSSLGYDVVLTREPGATALGDGIRTLLLEEKNSVIDARTEALLFAGDRAHHVASVIVPALKQGKIVISDRYTLSTLAYQGSGRGLDLDCLKMLNNFATYGLEPQIICLLLMPEQVGLDRVRQRAACDRIEQEQADFHHRVNQFYYRIAQQQKQNIQVVNATEQIDVIAEKIFQEIFPVVKQCLVSKECSNVCND